MLKQPKIYQTAILLLSLVLVSTLTGCLKVRLAVDVKSDGSGIVGFALGMTQQAKALVASQGEDPTQILTQDLSKSPNEPQDVKISRWTEGEYEWLQGEVAFKELNDLNERLSRVEYFETFSISRQPGIFRDRFILDARLKPLLENTPDSDSSDLFNIDPSAFIEVQMTVRLPGDVIETNGVFDGNDSSKMLWTVGSKQAITMHAVSETWNWLNIGIIGGGAFVAILAIGGMIFIVATSKPKRKKEISPSRVQQDKSRLPSASSPPGNRTAIVSDSLTTQARSETITPVQIEAQDFQPPNIPNLLVTIGARSLLQDVNHFLLKDIGTISESPDELRLEWLLMPDAGEIQSIHIRLINQNQATINGQVFPATHEGMKTGISASIRGLKRLKQD